MSQSSRIFFLIQCRFYIDKCDFTIPGPHNAIRAIHVALAMLAYDSMPRRIQRFNWHNVIGVSNGESGGNRRIPGESGSQCLIFGRLLANFLFEYFRIHVGRESTPHQYSRLFRPYCLYSIEGIRFDYNRQKSGPIQKYHI